MLSDATRPSFAALVNAAITQATSNGQTAEKKEDQVEEESDDWLAVDPSSLDSILREPKPDATQGSQMNVDDAGEDQAAEEQAKRLKDLAQKVQNFVEGEGELEGATFEE